MAVPAPANAPQTVRWWHWLWVAPLALFFRLWLATLRVRLAPGTREAESAAGGSAVIVLWHDRLFFAPVVSQRHLRRPVCALVSASKDGGWLTAFYNLMGIRCARGSSSSRGTEALMALARAMRDGCHAGVTPDGPKGPRREAKPGVLALARVAKAKVLLLGIRYHACWRLRSWDRFALPVPFSRVELSLEPAGGLPADESEACQAIGRRLDALSGD
jgi:lysophospholipid acyltransferase (LPLAT)-like uncharacterized protein